MDSESHELSSDSSDRSEDELSVSSGYVSSGFASDGFRSESAESSENTMDMEPALPYRRRRTSLWKSLHQARTRYSTGEAVQQISMGSRSILSKSIPPASDESNTSLSSLVPSVFRNETDDISFPSVQPVSTQSQHSDSTGQLRDFLFNIPGILGWKDLAKEQEVRSLSELLEIVDKGGLSEHKIRALLKTRRVYSHFSYDVLFSYLDRRSEVLKHYSLMCPLQHMAKRGPGAEGSICSSQSCELKIIGSHKFWFRYVSDIVAAICRELNSLKQLMNGCRRAKRAVMETDSNTFYDFYDRALFRRKYSGYLRNWDEEKELPVFLTFSSDGFEEIGGHRGPRTAWPLIFIILNFDPSHGFKAGNALLSGFIPGTYDPKLFDTFLEPLVTDLSMLERGSFLTCADGKRRKLRVFVMFITADYPAASKMLGFMGHMASFPCRHCHKRQTYVPEIRAQALIPSGGVEQRSKAISSRTMNGFEWLDLECEAPRTDRETRDTWRQLDALSNSTATAKCSAKPG